MELMKYDQSEFPTEFNKENFQVVGTGGFGEVRVCYHALLGRVALKLFRITGSNERIQKARREFESEAKILQQMKHPHIVTFHGVTSLFGREGLVMEFMEGGNLDDLIMSDTVLSWTERLRLLHELSAAISYLHNHDYKKAFIHSDIKPQNILLTKSRSLKLADFGSVNIRKRTGASTTTLDIPCSKQHTLHFTAPEFLKDLDVERTPAMDVYSYGIIVYEVLTRIQAFSDSTVGKEIIREVICNGTRPNQSKLDEVDMQLKQHQKQDHEIFLKLQSLMKECWQQEPTKRPKATKILETITQQMDELPATEGLDMEDLTLELPAMDGSEAACLIMGGSGTNKLVETYEVDDKSFKQRKSTLCKRDGSTSVKINNHVYTAGGGRSKSVECLNLNQVDGDWNIVASMNKQRWYAASAVLNDQMCVTGGWGGINALSSVELYNPVVNTWTNIAPMKTERFQHALVSYNGRLFAFGGGDTVGSIYAISGGLIGGIIRGVGGLLRYSTNFTSMESYDPREGKWKPLQSMNEERYGSCGVVYNDEIYAIGGGNLRSVERYNFRTNSWSRISRLNRVRWGSCACVVNGKIYVIGGSIGDDDDASKSIEAYDATINEWKIETNMETPRRWASVVAL
uniref:influenza virus NS1A-binding protein-like isoform X2 n=1 Tax=Ciona intestinalis TaxID=7719 RepID=UPI00089DAFF3|nr:influenza virus NS1A-binding protein-like isoform X2 [Ciona intestinalis]|eukprot:XP_009860409.2 influenza virus NS1A-binding protein-like isoform X2 [Ciona intestinalis]